MSSKPPRNIEVRGLVEAHHGRFAPRSAARARIGASQREFVALRGVTTDEANRKLSKFHSQSYEVELNLDGEGGIELLKGATGRTLAGVDADGQMYLDRAHSGRVEFHHGFAARHRAPRAASSELRVLVDRSSVEWFAGDGEAVISNRVFPAAADDGLQVFGGPGTRRRLLRVATIQ